jgi:cyclophilin family peptidyl-prolyl cis-trans isomerase
MHKPRIRCRMLRAVLIAATFCALGCPSHGPERSHPSRSELATRTRVARAEALRAGGIGELRELSRSPHDPLERTLALRGLGRIGGKAARLELVDSLEDVDHDIIAASLAALGVTASLDEPAEADRDALGSAIGDATAHCDGICKQAGLEALGRAGTVAQQPILIAALGDSKTSAIAALALGRFGRRKLALSDAAEAALVTAASSTDKPTRYAAIYALSRMVVGDEHAPTTAALVSVIGDPDPEIRATAIPGIAHRKQVAAAHDAIEHALGDGDWRVAVEAVRALAGDNGDDAGRAIVAAKLPALVARGDGAQIQVAIEALRTLLAHPPEQLAFTPDPGALAKLAPRSRGWIVALALAANARAAKSDDFDLTKVDRKDLPDAELYGVAAELAKNQSLAARRALLRIMLAHADVRVRGAALPLLASTWKDGEPGDGSAIVATFTVALNSPDIVLAGAASEAVDDLYDAIGDAPDRASLDAAIIDRAERERDPELAAALLELIGKRAIAGGVTACHAALAGQPVAAVAGADCLKALGQPADAPALATAQPPPNVDVANVIGKRVVWHLVTSRGEVAIELLPDVAPWNVATIVALTQKHYFDGLEFHRVVPDFVVQGGDPTMSGEGGPGFTTPAEPATLLDGAGFVTGGIGMADAGRDSAGSQWFAMHSRAPHLDGRYTWVGQVVSGQNIIDALLIGDRVEKATIDLERK